MSKFSVQLIRAIEASGMSRYRIAKITGISPATLSRMVNGDGWIGRAAMDKLAACLGIEMQTAKPREGKRPAR